MTRLLVGTLLWFAVVAIAAVIALRWPLVFWLLVLSVGLYLVFGRHAEIELRMGIGRKKSQKRLYAAVTWQRHIKAAGEPQVEATELEGATVEERVPGA